MDWKSHAGYPEPEGGSVVVRGIATSLSAVEHFQASGPSPRIYHWSELLTGI